MKILWGGLSKGWGWIPYRCESLLYGSLWDSWRGRCLKVVGPHIFVKVSYANSRPFSMSLMWRDVILTHCRLNFWVSTYKTNLNLAKPLSKDPLISVCSLTCFDVPRIVRSMWVLSILSRETLRTSKTTTTTRGPSDTGEKNPQDGMFGSRLIVLIFLSNTINVWMVYLRTFSIKINYMHVKHTVLYIDPMCFGIPSIKWPKPLLFHAFSLCIIGPRP